MPKRQHDREVVLIPVEVRDSGADFPEPWASILQEALGRVLGDPDDPFRRLSHVRALFRVESSLKRAAEALREAAAALGERTGGES